MMREEERREKQMNNMPRSVIPDILVAVIFLTCFGLVAICSASYTEGYGLFRKQAIFAVLGFVCGFIVVIFIPGKLIFRLTPMCYVLSCLSMFLLLTPLAVTSGGATRWIKISEGMQFQIVDVLKLGTILMLAYWLVVFDKKREEWWLVLLLWGTGGVSAALTLLISSDLGSACIILGFTFLVTFVFTSSEKMHYAAAALAVIVLAIVLFYIKTHMPSPSDDDFDKQSFRLLRIAAWLDPEKYASDGAFQNIQALYAIGNGGFWGKGLGNSVQKLGAVAESHTDFIFSIICEELGVFGAVLFITLMTYLFYLLFLVCIRTKSRFYSGIVVGIFMHLMMQSFFNLGVVTGILPNTGIPLPFISYGGTSLVACLTEIGLVLKIENHNVNMQKREIARGGYRG